jgi:hypothetical protein
VKQVVIGWICLLMFPGLVLGAAPAMVEKHIFLPEKPVEKARSVSSDALKANLLFTGVLISDKGRYAFIKEKKQAKDAEARKIFREGEDISGAMITAIHPNRLVLNNNGEEVVIRLYSGSKNRPAPVKAQPPPAVQATQPSPQAQTGQAARQAAQPDKSGQGSSDDAAGAAGKTLDDKVREKHEASGSTVPLESNNPFAQALKKAMEKKQAAPTAPATNPFIEAIRRAQGKQ